MQINLSLGFSRDVENDDFFGYLERVIVTFTALGRNHIVLTAFETIAKALLYWNSGVLLFRSSSEMFLHRHWERFEKHSLSIIVTKRECTRPHEASSNLRAAQVPRQGLLKSTLMANHFSKVSDQCCQGLGLLTWET